jgi:hypothetical protein
MTMVAHFSNNYQCKLKNETCFALRPMIQKKLDVLSEAGLNKESFSDLDTKTFQVRNSTVEPRYPTTSLLRPLFSPEKKLMYFLMKVSR